jgi:hypothetical protein
MATFPSNLGALLCADEATFAADTDVFDERLPAINSPNEMIAGLEQSKVPVPVTQQYQNDGRHEARGVFGGSFPVSLYLTGHGTTTAGAVASTDLSRALGRWLGVEDNTLDGGTLTGGTSATEFAVTGCTLAAGELIRVGALSDDKGNGQFYAINNPATTTILNAMEGTGAASDVVYASSIVHPAEDDTAATIVSERYCIQSANQRYKVHGCWCSALSFTGFNAGEIPRVDATISCSRWLPESASAWPTAVSVDAFTPAPVAGGSFFYNTVGTATLQTADIRDVQFSVDLQTVPLMGHNTDFARQVVQGVRRTRCQGMLSFTVDSEAAGTDTWGDLWNASSPNYIHWMLTLSAEDGSAVGIYSPKAKIVGLRPTQSDNAGVNAKRVTLQCLTGGTTTTDLTHSNFRIALA